MQLSLKQKQVIGVTFMVALIVIALSLLQLINTAGVLLAESRERFELFASAVYTQVASAIASPESAYDDVRSSPYVQSVLQSALYSPDTVDAFIVDPTGVVIASSDPDQVGKTLERRPQLNELIALVGEEHVERRQRAVAAGDVLLHLDLLVIRELRVRVDLLLQDAELVADHHDLVEERVDGDALLLRPFLAGLEDDLASLPSAAELDVGDTELIADHFP